MKRFLSFDLWPLALAAVLAGCQQDGAQDDAWRSGKPVRLTVSSGAIASVEHGGATRAADGQYTASTGFSGGEQVTVWMKDASSTASAVYDVGSPDAGKKSAVTVASGSTELEYPAEGSVTLYGVYPSGSTASHVVRCDQTSTTSGNANYKASDLMYARTTVAQSQQDDAQELVFNHQLVKLKVTVNKAADIGQVTAVTLNGVKRKVPVTVSESALTLGTATAAVSGDADYSSTAATNNSIQLGKSETASAAEATYTYVCLFPPQSWADTEFLTVTTDAGSAVFTASHSFTGGREYSVTLSVDDRTLSAKASIGNWTSGGAIPVTIVEN